jgi:hypothetical protein
MVSCSHADSAGHACDGAIRPCLLSGGFADNVLAGPGRSTLEAARWQPAAAWLWHCTSAAPPLGQARCPLLHTTDAHAWPTTCHQSMIAGAGAIADATKPGQPSQHTNSPVSPPAAARAHPLPGVHHRQHPPAAVHHPHPGHRPGHRHAASHRPGLRGPRGQHHGAAPQEPPAA